MRPKEKCLNALRFGYPIELMNIYQSINNREYRATSIIKIILDTVGVTHMIRG